MAAAFSFQNLPYIAAFSPFSKLVNCGSISGFFLSAVVKCIEREDGDVQRRKEKHGLQGFDFHYLHQS